jgi:hypothetical protein
VLAELLGQLTRASGRDWNPEGFRALGRIRTRCTEQFADNVYGHMPASAAGPSGTGLPFSVRLWQTRTSSTTASFIRRACHRLDFLSVIGRTFQQRDRRSSNARGMFTRQLCGSAVQSRLWPTSTLQQLTKSRNCSARSGRVCSPHCCCMVCHHSGRHQHPCLCTHQPTGDTSASRTVRFYPAFAVNDSGPGVIGFSFSGTNYFPSTGYVRYSSGSLEQKIHIAGVGTAPEDGFSGYPQQGGAGVARRGDYSAAVVSPVGTSGSQQNSFPMTSVSRAPFTQTGEPSSLLSNDPFRHIAKGGPGRPSCFPGVLFQSERRQNNKRCYLE